MRQRPGTSAFFQRCDPSVFDISKTIGRTVCLEWGECENQKIRVGNFAGMWDICHEEGCSVNPTDNRAS